MKPYRLSILAFLVIVAVAALLWYSRASAQDAPFHCTVEVQENGGFIMRCDPDVAAPPTVTATPPPTVIILPTFTPTPLQTPTSVATVVATSTPLPPATATPAPPTSQPTSTATPVPTGTTAPTATPVAVTGQRINVPLLAVNPGDPALDANNWSIIWAGAISPNGGYGQVRLAGANDGLHAYVQNMTPATNGGFGLSINGRIYDGTLRDASGWRWEGTGIGSRGFSAERVIPWQALGGKPALGDIWPLTFTSHGGGAWVGSLRWGEPDYTGKPGMSVLTVPVVADASLGGGTDCGWDNDPAAGIDSSWFEDWGDESLGAYGPNLVNLGAIGYANMQAQWDTTDWPCYARYIAKWGPVDLPAGATINGAWLDVYMFGYAYPGPNDVQEFAPRQVTQAYMVGDTWDEAAVTWDNAPVAQENVSRTEFNWCAEGEDCRGIRSVDVTEIVRRGGHSALLYTAAGQYHAGRYIYTREGSSIPVVRIAYTVEGGATFTPTPTIGAGPSATSTPLPSTPTPVQSPSITPLPTSTATATPQPIPTLTPIPQPTQGATATQVAGGTTYYIATNGVDTNPGGQTTPWRTFGRAWQTLQPGDTLLLMDGTYNQQISPTRSGQAGKPITVRAMNDGKAVIDGQGSTRPMIINTSWFVFDGLVVRNGSNDTLRVEGDNNVFRRMSFFDVNTDINSSVVFIAGDNNLVEDSIAAGSGRYMFEAYESNNSIFRRVFAMWGSWEGRQFCGVAWPMGVGIGLYNGSNGKVENSMVYGRVPSAGIMVQANFDTATANNNQVLGSIAVLAGRNYDGSTWTYGTGQAQPTTRPGPTDCTQITQWDWGTQRVGFLLWGQGNVTNNVFKDIVAVDNMGVGFTAVRPYAAGQSSGNVVERFRLTGNGAGAASWERSQGGQAYISLPGVTVKEGVPVLNRRYENGVLTETPLLPFPMEARAQVELGISISELWSRYD